MGLLPTRLAKKRISNFEAPGALGGLRGLREPGAAAGTAERRARNGWGMKTFPMVSFKGTGLKRGWMRTWSLPSDHES